MPLWAMAKSYYLQPSEVKFYEFLGMKMIRKIEQPEAKFDLYFMGYDSPKALSHGNHFSDREGLIELTHNYGTENDPNYKVATGNSEPGKGFGHTCISVDNLQAACQRIEDAGYKFQKKLTDGRMRHIAFALDPDGYWVEVIGQNPLEKTEGIKTTDTQTYRMVSGGKGFREVEKILCRIDSQNQTPHQLILSFRPDRKLLTLLKNHTMIRVKDHEKSMKFYKDAFGMTLMRTSENKDAKFNLYFLGYPGDKGVPTTSANGVNPVADREGLLELTWNYGTESDPNFKYHNGNDEPQGFGHICKTRCPTSVVRC